MVALLLMTLDSHNSQFHKQRQRMEVIVLPIQEIASLPARIIQFAMESVTTQQRLLEDNASLHAQQILLQAKLNRLMQIQQENSSLRALLQSSKMIPGKVEVAQLISVSLEPELHQIIINKGSSSGAYLGQPVLDAYGIMGQVIGVNAYSSHVLLASDKSFAIPVVDEKSGVRAVAVGAGSSHSLQLININDASDIKVGDMFLSSGLGLAFPKGYPVGSVKSVAKNSQDHGSLITLNIAAHLDRTQQVLLAWVDSDTLKQKTNAS